MEEGDNLFFANITNEPSDSVGICGLNATLIKEYVRYGLETLYIQPAVTLLYRATRQDIAQESERS